MEIIKDTINELAVSLINQSKKIKATEATITLVKCGSVDSAYSGWDIKVSVALPGTYEDKKDEE